MSLINQMLKDLEKRRAEGLAAPDSPLKGVPRYAAAQQRPMYVNALLIAGLVVALAVAGFFAWAYYSQSGAPDSAQARLAQADAVPDPAPRASPAPAPAVAQAPPTVLPATPRPPQASPAPQAAPRPAAPRTQAAPVEADSPGEPVVRRERPLTPQQQAEVLYQQAYQNLARNRHEAGEQDLRQALAAYPGHLRARELLAGVYIRAGRYVEAASLLREGVALAPDHSLFAKLYARVLLEQDKIPQAIQVLELRPPAPQADIEYYALLAALHQRNANHLQAATIYRDILQLNPAMGMWWVGLGVSLEQLGRQQEAQTAYERARATGNLSRDLVQYTDNRLAALRDSGLPR